MSNYLVQIEMWELRSKFEFGLTLYHPQALLDLDRVGSGHPFKGFRS